MKKSVRGLLLALAAAAALTLSALAAESGFARINTYAPGQFADVPEDIWCADNVKSAYEFGIMDGREEGRFDVGGSLTVAETITMACRIHSACTGADLPEGAGAGTWYQPYLDYAADHGVLWAFADYNAPVSRGDFAVIMDSALAEMTLPVISSVERGAIPDVAEGAACYEAVYRLYDAGILTGSDKRGTFSPDSSITRGEAAALISRIADPSLRTAVTLTVPEFVFTPVPVDQLQNYTSLKKKCTDEEFQAAYDEALKIVEPLAELSLTEQLEGVAARYRD